MPQFVVFAVAASMCVLCFAVGFIAALVLRIAQHSAASAASPSTGALDPLDGPASPRADLSRAAVTASPRAPAASISLPQAEIEERHETIPTEATAPVPRATHAVHSGGFPAPMTAPPAKVFLFGDPHLEAVVVPTVAPTHSAPPHAWTQPHAAPRRLAPAEIDLLPRRPQQHARSARRR